MAALARLPEQQRCRRRGVRERRVSLPHRVRARAVGEFGLARRQQRAERGAEEDEALVFQLGGHVGHQPAQMVEAALVADVPPAFERVHEERALRQAEQ